MSHNEPELAEAKPVGASTLGVRGQYTRSRSRRWPVGGEHVSHSAHGGEGLHALAAGSLFVAVVAFSRMYLGVHYLSDVLESVPISSAGILAWLPVWNHLIAPRISRIHPIQRLEKQGP